MNPPTDSHHTTAPPKGLWDSFTFLSFEVFLSFFSRTEHLCQPDTPRVAGRCTFHLPATCTCNRNLHFFNSHSSFNMKSHSSPCTLTLFHDTNQCIPNLTLCTPSIDHHLAQASQHFARTARSHFPFSLTHFPHTSHSPRSNGIVNLAHHLVWLRPRAATVLKLHVLLCSRRRGTDLGLTGAATASPPSAPRQRRCYTGSVSSEQSSAK